MPELKKKPETKTAPAAAPAKPVIPAKTVVETRPVLYPKLIVSDAFGPNALTAADAARLLYVETEEDYIKRVTAEDPQVKELGLKPSLGDNYLFKDRRGRKVQCWRSTRNRPFKEGWSKTLGQSILNRCWAGPTTLSETAEYVYGGDEAVELDDGTVANPGDKITLPIGTINGETIRIGRTGEVVSGNHSLVGLWNAKLDWEDDPYWQQFWPKAQYPDGPVLEALLVFGVSEHRKVIGTIDNTMPRSITDTTFTSEVFADLERPDRLECSRKMAKAIDCLWKRTGAGHSEHHGYKSNSEAESFGERHPKLLDAVKLMFELDKKRGVSILKVSAGACAGLMYLMGCSASKREKYAETDPPVEKTLDWKHWQKAIEFWTKVAKDEAPCKPVRVALNKLTGRDLVEDAPARTVEKHAIIVRAWHEFLAGTDFSVSDIQLGPDAYERDDKGNLRLIESADHFIGGIDLGEEPEEPETEEEREREEDVERRKAEVRKQLADEAAKKIADRRAAGTYANGKPTLEAVADKLTADGKVPAKPSPKPAVAKPTVKPTATAKPSNSKPAVKPGAKPVPAKKPAGKK